MPQPHGGALFEGGVPGNKGGLGRAPSALRERLRGSLAERIGVLEGIIDDPGSSPSDRVRAIGVLAQYGLGVDKELSQESVMERLRRTVDILREELDADQAIHLLRRLREVWGT